MLNTPKRSRRLKALACVLAMLTSLVVVTARPGGAQQSTIAQLAIGNPDLSTLVTALTVATDAGRVDFLSAVSDPAADLTVFAPTNAAFTALGGALDDVLADPSGALTDVLLYHVVGESLSGAELLAAGSATTLLGSDVTIGVANGRLTVNGAQITVASIPAANGVVHIIDAVLLPPADMPDPDPMPGTIAEIAVGNADLSTLVTALTVATDAGRVDFLGAVSDPSADLTVFAPTNAAFAALGGALNDVLADPDGALTDILLYHVLGSAQDGNALAAAGAATTLLGADVTVEVRNGNVFINDSQVVIANVQASNGIVHVIDAVLLPPADMPDPDPMPGTIAEIAVGNADLSTLVTALTVATDAGRVDFLGAVSDPNADLTVFAPTNAAFAALGGALNDVLADPDGALTDILLYHVLGTSEAGADLAAAGSATTLLGTDVTVEVRNGNVFINDSQVVIANVQASNGIVHVIDAVLLPPADMPDPDPAPQTIAEIAVGNADLSTLVTALTVATDAGRVNFLGLASDPNADLTVFAPTNAAFAALGGALDDVLADPSGALTDVLLYHVLGSSQDGNALVGAGSATTLLGEDVVVEVRNGNVFINNSQVVIANVQAANGIVHVIDAVLLPAPAGGDSASGSGSADGDIIYLKNAATGRYLDADFNGHEYNVDTSSTPREDDEWQLEAIGNGNYRLRNVKYDKYMDADPRSRRYNVDLGRATNFGAEWEIIELANGRNLLRTVDFDRYLDGDRYNVDTSSAPKLDDEWEFIPVP